MGFGKRRLLRVMMITPVMMMTRYPHPQPPVLDLDVPTCGLDSDLEAWRGGSSHA